MNFNQFLNEGSFKPMGLSIEDTKKVAETYAKAIAKIHGEKCTVNTRTLEEDSFDLDFAGEEFDGGSYSINSNGDVSNDAMGVGMKNPPIYGKWNDSVETIIKNIKKLDESVVNEGKGFKNTEDFEAFLEEIDGMPESAIKKIMGKDYIDTPGGYRDEAEDYDNDITEYMISNMGRKEFEELKNYWENNVAESFINEAEIKSDEEFSEYAMTVLKKAFGAEFDEAKAKKVADGILAKSKGDYGTAVGMLTSSLGESVTNEAKEFSFTFNYNTDEDDVEYIQNILKKAGVNATAEAGLDMEEMEVKAVSAIELRKAKKAIEADGFQINEAIDTKYWADYNTDTSGQGNKEFANKSKDFEDTFSLAVAEWNDEADGAENRIIGSQVDKVKKLAKEFFKKEGYISVNIAQAMIAQES